VGADIMEGFRFPGAVGSGMDGHVGMCYQYKNNYFL